MKPFVYRPSATLESLAPMNIEHYSNGDVNLHDFLTVHTQIPTTHHLQINRRQRQRPPFAGRLLVHLDDFGFLRC